MRQTVSLIALALVAAGCASTGATPQPFPRPAGGSVAIHRPTSTTPAAPAPESAIGTFGSPPATTGYAIAGTALGLRGAPYRNGGNDPSGFDCSGFIWYVFAQHGIRVPRTVGEQFHTGTSVTSDALEPGDLLFFSTDSPGASHVGMAIGGVEFVHAPSSRGIVRVERLTASYWASRYIGARRLP